MNPKLQELADQLIGTASMGLEVDALTSVEQEEFAKLAFECVECGWWYSADDKNEVADGFVCSNCLGDE